MYRCLKVNKQFFQKLHRFRAHNPNAKLLQSCKHAARQNCLFIYSVKFSSTHGAYYINHVVNRLCLFTSTPVNAV